MTWTSAPLGKVTTVLSGTTPKSENPAYWNGSHVWVTPMDLGKLASWEIKDSGRRISDAGVASCNLPLVPSRAIVMSSRAPIGHLAIAGRALHTNQGCKSFVCSDVLDPEFLFLTLRFRMSEIQALGSGATFVEVSKSALESFKISFPDLAQQRRIAARLKTQLAAVEQARQAAQAQLVESEALLHAIYRESFSDVPDGSWIRMEKVAPVQSGYAFKSADFKRAGVRLLRNTNILPGRVYWKDVAYMDATDANRFERFALREGDVLLSLDRPIISGGLKIARVTASDLPSLLVQRVGRFEVDADRIDSDYLFAFLSSDPFIKAITGHDQSLGVPHISPDQVGAIEMPLPTIAQQRGMVRILNQRITAASRLLNAAQAQLADLEALPARLLAQAFDPDHVGEFNEMVEEGNDHWEDFLNMVEVRDGDHSGEVLDMVREGGP